MPTQLTRRGFLAATGGSLAAYGAVGQATGTPSDRVRFAAFNIENLTTDQVQEPGDEQAAAAARVVQEARPDVLALNEVVNNVQKGERTDRTNARAFVEEYLTDPQAPGLSGIDYEYVYVPESNTGVHSGYDLDNNGETVDDPGSQAYGDDAFGFGLFPGQYALALVSRYPIEESAVRSFREFRWTDMPDNFAVRDDDESDFYLNDEEAEVFRLSSKTHVDVPVDVGGRTVHSLLAHPTPPGFDGPENFNGRRCHDEVRLFADYVAGAEYLYDDDGVQGGLADDASYVLMGDMNASPGQKETYDAATKFLLDNDDFEARRLPTSPGGARRGNPQATFDSVDQIDYVLPSPDLGLRGSKVVWPATDCAKRGLGAAVATASDHRLVWADVDTGR
ncbi:endonuclease/exonuclease/phosphatase family protein [Halomarina ordinaria]|uniref:Endonuclease/exonuclease/phosphatase family protein n=1 Tax=Halomarina ordinaria TaxID=3033939 RepID=A0ABD5U363_9EURY|nr:endonuclease/exonuclease/phosphatase family protein [Halomarina sp. PSRA2]